jgi:subtilisin family serine protease
VAGFLVPSRAQEVTPVAGDQEDEMSETAIITLRGAVQEPEPAAIATPGASLRSVSQRVGRSDAAEMERIAAVNVGTEVQLPVPQGTLIHADRQQLAQLEEQGFRVKMLPDRNILGVGSYRIDVEAGPPDLPTELEVPAELASTWPHHLVQLGAPPTEDLIASIEQQPGVDVVGPISVYGLFVVGNPDDVAALRQLPTVSWVGPFQPAYRIHENLTGLTGQVRYLSIGVYPTDQVAGVKTTLVSINARIMREEAPPDRYQDRGTAVLLVEVGAEHIPALARLPYVRWLEFAAPKPVLDGERDVQILAGNLDGFSGGPIPGYKAWLTDIGVSGAGVTIAICDYGVDANAMNNEIGHLDLRGRQANFVDYTESTFHTDTHGHGTHVAAIAVGNGASAQVEGPSPKNFLWGQGVAPEASFVTQNALFLYKSDRWPPDFGELTRDAVESGAQVMNNSFTDGLVDSGYTPNASKFDRLVRDPNDTSAGLDYLVIVFSAGNEGPGASTITPPKETKNAIVVGASDALLPNLRAAIPGPDILHGVYHKSSRGPAKDGRYLPTVVAPGTSVASALSATADPLEFPPIPGTGIPDPTNPNNLLSRYTSHSGTSMAAAHVSGCCALLIEWWRKRHNENNPSPALLKALLINGADDLGGGFDGNGCTLSNIPNNDQGWGRVNLKNMLQQCPDFPDSDRGPSLYFDQKQEHNFTAELQEHAIRVEPFDEVRPLRITLVWTDVPAHEHSDPALVNDLDLEVEELNTGTIFKGNWFANGFSIGGGDFDNLDNIECVYVQHPSGNYDVRVIASSLKGNALPPFDPTPWQDFALVIENAVEVTV